MKLSLVIPVDVKWEHIRGATPGAYNCPLARAVRMGGDFDVVVISAFIGVILDVGIVFRLDHNAIFLTTNFDDYHKAEPCLCFITIHMVCHQAKGFPPSWSILKTELTKPQLEHQQ